MRFVATLTCALGLLVWSSPAPAQGFGYGARAGVSVPLGVYANTTDGVGFSGGLDFRLPLTFVSPALSWYTSIDLARHSVDEASLPDATGGFYHIPALTGLRLDVGAPRAVSPFATAQVGAAFPLTPTIERTTSRKLGFGIGGGLQVTPSWYAGARWVKASDVRFGGRTELARWVEVYLGHGVR
jgi:hypothetical protein